MSVKSISPALKLTKIGKKYIFFKDIKFRIVCVVYIVIIYTKIRSHIITNQF